jgi:hypothetical protein
VPYDYLVSYTELIQFYGSQAAAARAIGIKPPSVDEWKVKGIPLPRQAQYELDSGGALKADPPRRPAEERAA